MSSIGDWEKLAGVEDRAAFWKAFPPQQYASTQEYIDAGMEACDRLIEKRLQRGELCLLPCTVNLRHYAQSARKVREKARKAGGKARRVAA